MPSLSRLVNRLVLVNRISPNKAPAQTHNEVNAVLSPSNQFNTINLPTSLSRNIPQELCERIIDHLYDSIPSLLSCSLVCRAWVPASRYHLFRGCVVHPSKLIGPGERNVRVNCAVSSLASKFVLFGTDDGIYVSQTPRSRPFQVVVLRDPVTQIDLLEDYDLVIFLSARQVFTIQLQVLRLNDKKLTPHLCTRIAGHVSFFNHGVISGKHLVCIVKVRGSSTTCKLLQPVLETNTQYYELCRYKEFYIGDGIISLHFLRTKLVAGPKTHDFEAVDVDTLTTQPLLHPSAAVPNKGARCVAALRAHNGVLVCYDSIAVLVDHEGRPLGRIIRWRDKSIYDVALHEPYLVAFGTKHIEIFHLDLAIRVQTVTLDYDLISTAPELFTIRTRDGELLTLQFTKSE